MATPAEIEEYVAAITSTGFVLEANVAEQFRNAGWIVIGNRYYLDDVEEKAREVDVLAYKNTTVKNVVCRTAVLISCKKSESAAWGLIARPADIRNPNYNFTPVHLWSNDRAVAYEFALPNGEKSYHDIVHSAGAKSALPVPTNQIYAFQEITRGRDEPSKKPNGSVTRIPAKAGNDGRIFDSVSGLMKAQSYELRSLPKRQRNPSFYQVNLLTVIDAELWRFDVSGGEVSAHEVETEDYFASYIVNKVETQARIRFTRLGSLPDVIAAYDDLHKANAVWFEGAHVQFYNSVFKDGARMRVFLKDFSEDVTWVYSRASRLGGGHKVGGVNRLSTINGKVAIGVDSDADTVAMIAEDDFAQTQTKHALLKYYDYRGDFTFIEDDIPF